MDQISLQTKLALLKVLPDVIRESAKPLEAIESIKIVQVDGLMKKGGTSGGSGNGGSTGNLAQDAVSAALAYRAQAPVLDGLMKELGLDGSSLSGLVGGSSAVTGEDSGAKVSAAPSKGKSAPPVRRIGNEPSPGENDSPGKPRQQGDQAAG